MFYYEEDFDFAPEVNNEETESIDNSEFEIVGNKGVIYDQKFETRPTTFLKDSIKRFSKNKSSVVAAWILGTLLVLSFIIPIVDPSDTVDPSPRLIYLEPKLFGAGTGFWDGCRNYSDITLDTKAGEFTDKDGKIRNGSPATDVFNPEAVFNFKVDDTIYYTNSYQRLAYGGYVNFSAKVDDNGLYTKEFKYNLDWSSSYKVKMVLEDIDIENYVRSSYNIDFKYFDTMEGANKSIRLLDSSTTYDGTVELDVISKLKETLSGYESIAKSQLYVSLNILPDTESFSSIAIKSFEITTDSTNATYKTTLEKPGFNDANEMVGRVKDDDRYWSCLNGNKYIYKAEFRKCSFTYDTYENAFGKKLVDVDRQKIEEYIDKGWCEMKFTGSAESMIASFKKLDERCPINKITYVNKKIDSTNVYISITCEVTMYRYLGYDFMPIFLMGTDKSGKDMLKYVFEGLRTSLLLGIISSAVCLIIGVVWGSISGYFGGAVDLAMERFTDILGGLPWIVVMTLCIIHLGQTFFVFALALCMTGWIGTSHLTRTQFYRFKGREYVLASRTLGAKDMRLIFKHILPNAMGTIITSSVLMIPSVIFSEATISYLGLGLKNLSSLGVILSNNQGEILQHSYLLIFPSVIIALLMISFNLFGNGLRDAVNPSLKGESE